MECGEDLGKMIDDTMWDDGPLLVSYVYSKSRNLNPT